MNHQIDLASVSAPAADFDVFPFMNRLKQEASGQPPSASLERFHAALLLRFPDAPFTKEFSGPHGRLTLMQRAHDMVPHILHIASELGLTVLDKKSAVVHRPPRYQVMVDDVFKRGLSRSQAMKYVAVLRGRGHAHARVVLEEGSIELPEPPAPPSPPPGWRQAQSSSTLFENADSDSATRHVVSAADSVDDVAIRPLSEARLYDMASGVRMMCAAIVIYAVVGVLGEWDSGFGVFASAIATSLYLLGSCRIAKGLLSRWGARLAFIVLVTSLMPAIYAFSTSRFDRLDMVFGLLALNGVFSLCLVFAGVRKLKENSRD
jgi:hypothetical protein